ncbi:MULTISPECIES: TetR/AcrR family transcriptional regulator [unclassified Modestobacter]
MPTSSATRPARERLLTAAAELFYEGGIAATGVDAVLRRAGVAPATMYAHFAGKDALVAAYLQERHERWRATWDEVLQQCTDPAARLLSLFDAVARYRRQEGNRRGCGFLAAATELPGGHPGQTWLAADTRLLTERLQTLAQEAGADDPGSLAGELLLVYDGALARYARYATTPELAHEDPLPAARRLAETVVQRRLGTAAG